ncbi:alpha/beta fold hydrolase [Sporosarcina contaminans]|uniref:Alpha/beta fold hydrolase n=1 Tax=Sporosarcina contaminans TaxID=633403 RepID=A0ABW3TV30_9BACL
MDHEEKKNTNYINLNNQKVYFNIVGNGEPIVFLHGGPGSQHQFFLPHVLPLSKNYKLIFYDQTGCGQSETEKSGQYSMSMEVEVLELLRKKLCLTKMNLFGESWGSMLALLYATTYPERVNGLFLTAAIGVTAQGYKSFQKELMKRLSLKDKIRLFIFSFKKVNKDNERVLEVLDPYYVFSKESLQKKKVFKMNKVVKKKIIDDIVKNYDLTDKLFKLDQIPDMVAQGSHDILDPSKIKQLLIDYIPHAILVEINNAGHWTVVEKPQEIISIAKDFFSSSNC